MTGRITKYARNNVLGLVAIFIALGAGAYAAGLPKNSVKSKQIKAGAVKTDELADNAVTSPKVANGSLLSEDFAADQLQGLQGPQGERGLQGPAGATNVVTRIGDAAPGWTAGGQEDGFASCNPGETAVGGGWETLDHANFNEVTPRVSRPAGNSWSVIITTSVTDTNAFLRVYVRCASP